MLIAIHEGGHLFAAKAMRLRVFSMEISGLGGRCWVENPKTTAQALMVHSGGLIAQLALFLASIAYIAIWGSRQTLFAGSLLLVFTFWNAFLFVSNLLPVKRKAPGLSSDGYKIYSLVRELLKK